eukprot:RCo035432
MFITIIFSDINYPCDDLLAQLISCLTKSLYHGFNVCVFNRLAHLKTITCYNLLAIPLYEMHIKLDPYFRLAIDVFALERLQFTDQFRIGIYQAVVIGNGFNAAIAPECINKSFAQQNRHPVIPANLFIVADLIVARYYGYAVTV